MDIRSYPEIVSFAYRQALRLLRCVNHYPYHNIGHTLDVTGRAHRIGKSEWLSQEDMVDLIIAALFHDTGFTKAYKNNEAIGAEIAREWLIAQGFPEDRIHKIERIILATVLFSTPETLAEKIIQDADLDNLGRADCFKKTEAYRKELEKYSEGHDDMKFFAFTETLLKRFRFHTTVSKKDRQAKLEENANAIRTVFPHGFH